MHLHLVRLTPGILAITWMNHGRKRLGGQKDVGGSRPLPLGGVHFGSPAAECWSHDLVPWNGLGSGLSRILLVGVFLYVFLAGCVSFRMNYRSTSAGIFKQIAS